MFVFGPVWQHLFRPNYSDEYSSETEFVLTLLEIRNRELRFFLPETGNCELENYSFCDSFSILIPVPIPDKLLKIGMGIMIL